MAIELLVMSGGLLHEARGTLVVHEGRGHPVG